MRHLQTESLKKAACSAAVSIAEKIAATQQTAVADAAKQILQSTDDRELTRRVQELLTRAETNRE